MHVGLKFLAATVSLLISVPAATCPGWAEVAIDHQDWGPTQLLTESVRVDELNSPVVEVTSRGTAVAVWNQDRAGSRPNPVLARTRGPNSDVWTPPTLIASSAFYSAIATHGRHATIAWQSHEVDGASISARTLHADGTWGRVQQVARWHQTGGVTVALVLAANLDGDMVAVWTRGKYTRVAYRPAGYGWGAPEVLPVRHAYALYAYANVDSAGAVDVVFPAPGPAGKDAVYAYHRASGGQWSGSRVAPSAGAELSQESGFDAAGNPHGDLAITWSERAGPGSRWHAVARYRSGSDALGSVEQVATRSQYPAVDLANDGTAFVAWERRSGDSTAIELAQRRPSGGWLPKEHLFTRAPLTFGGPGLHVDANARGDVLVDFSGQHMDAGSVVEDIRVVRCRFDSPCGGAHWLRGPSAHRSVSMALAPTAGAAAVWAFGCATEECLPTGVRARRLAP